MKMPLVKLWFGIRILHHIDKGLAERPCACRTNTSAGLDGLVKPKIADTATSAGSSVAPLAIKLAAAPRATGGASRVFD